MNFKRFLEQTNQDEQYENTIAEYIYKTIEKAVQDYFSNGKQTNFYQILANNSGGNIKNLGSAESPESAVEFGIPNNIQLPQSFLSKNIKIRVRPSRKAGANADYGQGLMSIYLDTNSLNNAKDSKDQSILQMLMFLEQRLHHESTHISTGEVASQNMAGNNPYLSGAKQGTEEYDKGKISYYTDQGELKAHAKQYAIMYARFYPNQPFSVDKMLALSSYDPKIERFFRGLQEGPGQSKIWGMDTTPYIKQLQQAGQTFTQMVQGFIGQRINPQAQNQPVQQQKGQIQIKIDNLIANYIKNGGYNNLIAGVNQIINQNPQAKDKITQYFNIEYQKQQKG